MALTKNEVLARPHLTQMIAVVVDARGEIAHADDDLEGVPKLRLKVALNMSGDPMRIAHRIAAAIADAAVVAAIRRAATADGIVVSGGGGLTLGPQQQ